ncbi:hypothetical protein SAMN02745194_00223 [Roseomonas rosea]|jgi:hypothetical protein|uniref:Uncharacterized protein n=1 Tax=Muricoccus roseus TaxID=198092 RepID=A0A1M6ARD0_9PROT|nr:hypothetical protein [Roseomonas rosea]SHI38971.1 hypothetical protein SAMN02745194_00223 [Roseomonas rosea]
MPVFADGRIPVSVVADEAGLRASLAARPGAALLAEAAPATLPPGVVATAGFDPAAPHPVACTCCVGRSPLAQALDALFLARVKGQAKWFTRVVALLPAEEARIALDEALRGDSVVASRYRPDVAPPEG